MTVPDLHMWLGDSCYQHAIAEESDLSKSCQTHGILQPSWLPGPLNLLSQTLDRESLCCSTCSCIFSAVRNIHTYFPQDTPLRR